MEAEKKSCKNCGINCCCNLTTDICGSPDYKMWIPSTTKKEK